MIGLLLTVSGTLLAVINPLAGAIIIVLGVVVSLIATCAQKWSKIKEKKDERTPIFYKVYKDSKTEKDFVNMKE